MVDYGRLLILQVKSILYLEKKFKYSHVIKAVDRIQNFKLNVTRDNITCKSYSKIIYSKRRFLWVTEHTTSVIPAYSRLFL
jgi:hypothetical protein